MKPQTFLLRWRRLWVLPFLIGMAMTLTACGNDGKKSSQVSVGGYIPGCPGCTPTGVTGNIVAAAIAYRESYNEVIELGLRVFAASGAIPAAYYTGPVTSQGYLFVHSKTAGQCGALPPGYYTIRNIGANGVFAPDRTIQPWNLTTHVFDLVHSQYGFVVRAQVNYAEFYDQGIVLGLDNLQYPHAMYGETYMTLASPVTVGGCVYRGGTVFFPK